MTFVLPLIVDSIFNKNRPWLFMPNTIQMPSVRNGPSAPSRRESGSIVSCKARSSPRLLAPPVALCSSYLDSLFSRSSRAASQRRRGLKHAHPNGEEEASLVIVIYTSVVGFCDIDNPIGKDLENVYAN